MARPVTLGSFQAMQRGESDASGDHEIGSSDVATVDPMTGAIVSAEPPMTVPEQLRLLEIRKFSAGTPLDEVAKRLRARADLLGIPAIDEEIRAEAKRRTGKTAGDAEPDPLGAVVAEIDAALAGDETPIEPKPDDQVEQPALGANIHGIVPDTDGGPNPDYDPAADPLAPAAEQLAALRIGASCTAEMSLSMIRGRVAREALLISPVPSQDEITAEAERILRTFDANRSGPREYDVVNGEVHDWRRPVTTPDRGDVTKVHTVSDEARFSGGGSDDAQQQSLFLVPTDAQFNGKLYRDAPELANLAEKLIGEHGFLEDLVNCEIRYYWRRKTGVSKGRVKIGYCKRASDLLGHFSGADFIIWLSATTARDGKFTDRQVEAALFHQLLHIETDDEGNFISARHDFEGFAQEIRHYGTWTEDLKVGGQAVVAAQQLGLLDLIDEGIEDEDDGSPLSDEEIAEQEQHERDDDPLADHDL